MGQLKRLYVLPYNRPHCDFLLYILDVKFVPNFRADYNMLFMGTKRPAWRRHFADEWDKSASREVEIHTPLTKKGGHASVMLFYLADLCSAST